MYLLLGGLVRNIVDPFWQPIRDELLTRRS
jgi:hypothetical protein